MLEPLRTKLINDNVAGVILLHFAFSRREVLDGMAIRLSSGLLYPALHPYPNKQILEKHQHSCLLAAIVDL